MFSKLATLKGDPSPLGISFKGDRANFAVFSSHASQVYLALFPSENPQPEKILPMNRTQDIWHIAIEGLPEAADYAFRCEGPYEERGGHCFHPSHFLADPYAKTLHTPHKWGTKSEKEVPPHTRAKAFHMKAFDWQSTTSPNIPYQDLIIYEMHVRGFTRHLSSGCSAPGTYLGIIEKIPYLKKLGVNAIELMPIFEFDETHCPNIHPKSGQFLSNYWGYNPLHFFSPMRRYAFSEDLHAPMLEFKTLVREMHKNGIEVFLDVVYNHTGEGKEKDYWVNFRGLDNCAYYMIDELGQYLDYTGCGNTFNTNHPITMDLILESLRYWIQEMHVDGFRFDLASILTRGPDGKPLANPPILKAMADDPVISAVKLIAEAWDASGLYQIGAFPNWGPWSEWNGRYRDVVRRFIKGSDGKAGLFANVLCGSQMVYSKTPLNSINFVTAHDGYTLRDLVTYQEKHNLDNGEMNRDGANQNDNWNCGAEGATKDKNILDLRERQMRNFLLALFLSQGIPMLLMGDEYGHTRNGNNNPYVQDNEINWFLWDELKKNANIFAYVQNLIAFRKKNPQFRETRFLTDADIEWHGNTPNQPNWDSKSRFVAFTLKGSPSFYVAFNANYQPATIALPNGKWRQVTHTSENWSFTPENGKTLSATVELMPYSALLAKME